MIDEKDIQTLEHRFDQRYKLISDCNEEMDEVKRELERLAAKMDR